jgi:protocatechuate 3,4-dioxygenase beta subunit
MRWPRIAVMVVACSVSASASAFTQASGFEINGKVVDARSGDALENVQVTLSIPLDDWKTVATAKTGSDGHFHFAGLAPAKYAVAGEKRRYRRQYLDEHEGFSTNIAVGPNLAPIDIVFRLHRDARITGRVTDDQNDPVREAEVYLFCTCAERGRIIPHLDEQFTTDARGVYRFSHKDPGKYWIAVSATPWYAQNTSMAEAEHSPLDVVFPLTFYGGANEPAAANTIVLSWGDSKTADVILHAVPALRLRVVNAASGGEEAAKASLEAHMTRRVFGTDIPMNGQTLVDETGTINVGGLAPGKYEMTLEIGETEKLLQKTIDITSNTEIRGAEGLRQLAVLTGKVQQNDEELALSDDDDVTVLLRDVAGASVGKEWSAGVNQDGSFTFEYRPSPGKYHVDVSGAGLVLKSVEGTGASGLTVEIGENGGEVELTLAVEQARGTVEGVALHDGKPRSGAMIVLVPQSRLVGLYRRDQSDSDGTFALTKVAPGKYTAIAFESWEVEWQDPEVLKRALPHGTPVTVAGDGKYQVVVKVQ